jgi:hypothetical protein
MQTFSLLLFTYFLSTYDVLYIHPTSRESLPTFFLSNRIAGANRTDRTNRTEPPFYLFCLCPASAAVAAAFIFSLNILTCSAGQSHKSPRKKQNFCSNFQRHNSKKKKPIISFFSLFTKLLYDFLIVKVRLSLHHRKRIKNRNPVSFIFQILCAYVHT